MFCRNIRHKENQKIKKSKPLDKQGNLLYNENTRRHRWRLLPCLTIKDNRYVWSQGGYLFLLCIKQDIMATTSIAICNKSLHVTTSILSPPSYEEGKRFDFLDQIGKQPPPFRCLQGSFDHLHYTTFRARWQEPFDKFRKNNAPGNRV